jgi:phospholipid transport system substrate-binding protein
MRALVAEVVDFRNAASAALGFEWSMRSTSEREEFARLFADLLQTSVFSSVGARARIDNGLSVTYVGELPDANGVTVATTVLTRGGSEMAVGYRMSQRQGRWMVHDVVIDGVSIVDNYRAQFHKVMQRSSYGGLVSEMRNRIADLGRPSPPVAATPAPGTVVPAAPAVVVAAPTREEVVVVPEPAPVVPAPVVVAAAPAETVRVPDPPKMVAAAATAPRPVVAQRVARAKAYWVQVGAFKNAELAMRLAAALSEYTVSLIAAPDQPLMRVLIGPFTDRTAASAKLQEVQSRGYPAFIAEVASPTGPESRPAASRTPTR